MAKRRDFTKAFIFAAITGLLLSGLFFITQPDKVSAAAVPPPNTAPGSNTFPFFTTPTPKIQSQVQGSFFQNSDNGYNAVSGCSSMTNGAVYAYNQNVFGTAITKTHYINLYTSWGFLEYNDMYLDNMLNAPSRYNMTCYVNAPQVQWK